MLPILVAAGAALITESVVTTAGVAVATAVLTSSSSDEELDVKSNVREISENEIPKEFRGKI